MDIPPCVPLDLPYNWVVNTVDLSSAHAPTRFSLPATGPIRQIRCSTPARQVGDETLLLVRVEDRRGHSHLTVARSHDGVTNWRIDSKPSFSADPANYAEEEWGVEDPVTWIRTRPMDHRLHGLLAPRSAGVVGRDKGLHLVPAARSGHARREQRRSRLSSPFRQPLCDDSSSGFRGEFAAHIWLSLSPDLIHWGSHNVLIPRGTVPGGTPTRSACSPPLETPEGWLILYHGVRTTAGGCLYRLGLALLDLADPCRVLRRSDEWVFAPEMPYERQGDVNGVVFPCGWILDKPSGEIRLYYGGADTCLALATAQLFEVLGVSAMLLTEDVVLNVSI